MDVIKENKGVILLALLAISGIILLMMGSHIIETCPKGSYQIKQAAYTGNLSAKMTPGLWMQNFGDIKTWPKAETFFFTSDIDAKGDTKKDESIEVRFNDGSRCNIAGTLRIMMPTNKNDAINLTDKEGYENFKEVLDKLIKPTVRNVLRTSSNLMSAKESYDNKRLDFVSWSIDQIQNGMYQTEDTIRRVKDVVSGEEIEKTFKIIKTDKNGNPLYMRNPLEGTGIIIRNFEIKKFDYEKEVEKQIAEQQKALMAVSTAKANAAKAQQDKLTNEEQGKAKVAKAKYEEEEKKIRQVVIAQQQKEVAIVAGEQRRDVAKLDKESASLKKQELILLGQGESERKRLVLAADGALKEKLSALIQMNKDNADAFSKRNVPMYNMNMADTKSGGLDSQNMQFLNTLNAMMVKNLGLDMTIKK